MGNRLYPDQKDSIMNGIVFTEEFYEEFKKRLFLAVQKHNSSRKTKIVHNLIENNNFDLVLFTGNDDIAKVRHIDNKLLTIYLNAIYFADFIGDGIVGVYSKIIDIIAKLDNEEKIMSTQRIYNITKLKEEYKKWMNKFLDSFDYSKIIDGLYYGFLKFLFTRAYKSNINITKKFLLLNSQYLSKFIQHIYLKTTKTNVDSFFKEKLNIITDFFVLVYYFGDSSMVALKKIEKAYGKDATEFLKKSNHLNCTDFENLADLLYETDIFKIQKNIFNMFFKKEFGEIGFKLLKDNKAELDSFLCSINHKNFLFNSISIDDKLSFNMEELILNDKSNIIFTKQIKKFI